ncbi:MAG: hypothetical protein ACJAXR_001718 [Halopseudomonas sp.]|jgi:hypothetical protein
MLFLLAVMPQSLPPVKHTINWGAQASLATCKSCATVSVFAQKL